MSKHTPLTVSDEASGFVYLEDESGKKVLTVYGCSAVKIDRAHRIALCWNAHDKLVEALLDILAFDNTYTLEVDDKSADRILNKILVKANNAIEKAGKEA